MPKFARLFQRMGMPEVLAIAGIALTAHSFYVARKTEAPDFAMIEVTGATVFGMLAPVSFLCREISRRDEDAKKQVRLPDPASLPAGVQVVFLITGTNEKMSANDIVDLHAVAGYTPAIAAQNKNNPSKILNTLTKYSE